MTLERRDHGTKTSLILTECPACGKRFAENGGYERKMHFLNDHGPADFGLTPLRD